MERFPPAKLVKAGNKIIVLIHLKTNADLINILQIIKLTIIETKTRLYYFTSEVIEYHLMPTIN